ncbi:C4-dicarboxylate TRAP transporter substrate-binding protein [Lachnospiraceae bacterium 62-35]
MKKRVLAGLMAGMMTISLLGCGGNSSSSGGNSGTAEQAQNESEDASSSGETKVLKLSHNFLSTQPLHKAMEEVAKNVEERTGGTIKIEIYENAQIANGVDGAEQCIRGADLINVYDASCMGDWIPDYNALVGPFLYDSADDYIKLCHSDWVQSLNEKAEQEGIKVLSLDYCFGFRQIGTGKKVIESLDDMKGLKIRVPKSSLWVETFKALGASPTAMGWSEIYNGLQTNVIEGMESGLSDIYDNQLSEVLDNITMTGHMLGTAAVMMSSEVFNSLTEEEQQILLEEFEKGSVLNNELFDKADEEARKAMEEEGIVFHEVDREPFKEACKSYYDTMPGLSEGVYEIMMEEIAK